MKRKELWELLGEVPADMIEEASIPRKGNRVLWLRRVLPLAAAVVLLTATAVAAGKYFGWKDILGTPTKGVEENTEPLAVQVDARGHHLYGDGGAGGRAGAVPAVGDAGARGDL